MEIKDKLKNRRLELNLTLQEVADIVGVSKATIQRYESGNIDNMRRDKIALLAKALQVSPAFIMGLDENKSNRQKTSNPFPPLNARDERSIQKRMQALLDDLAPSNSAMAYFDGDEPMSDEDKELLRISLENTMRLAKQMAKQKFTPKKYRK